MSASDQAPPPLLSFRWVWSTSASELLSLELVVSDCAVDEPDVADSEPPPDPLFDALLPLVVSPPVAVAVLLLEALPLSVADWDESPPLPPVAVLEASPELPALAVDELLPSELLDVDLLPPVLPVAAAEYASPPLLSSFCDWSTLPSALLQLDALVSDVADELFDVEDSDPLPDPLLDAVLLEVVDPPVALAPLLFDALPLPVADCDELPPLPPVALLEAFPELVESAVDELLPELLLELELAPLLLLLPDVLLPLEVLSPVGGPHFHDALSDPLVADASLHAYPPLELFV
ncbi:MAG: hypothetical protein JOY68_08325 [Candidatus Dormibacteraeota bacterium]|nr:hypothetical protein [Candidatus Dormibacteraeota bacterium]